MDFFKAVLLGLIQGLTEFLPISSTAHLTLAGRAMGLIHPGEANEQWTAFIAVIQLGTLLAVLAYFRSDLIAICRAFIGENIRRTPFQKQSDSSRTGWYIIIGTLPIVTIGLLLKKVIEGPLTKNMLVIAGGMILFALLLEIAERVAKFSRPIEKTSVKDSLVIGTAQVFALIPGASRSGTTITAGLFAGLTREAAARFSFLLSIPAVAASGVLELVKSLKDIHSADLMAMVVAGVVAAITGYWSIAFLLRYLRTRSTRIFIIYRIVIGIAILLVVLGGYLAP